MLNDGLDRYRYRDRTHPTGTLCLHTGTKGLNSLGGTGPGMFLACIRTIDYMMVGEAYTPRPLYPNEWDCAR